MKLYNVADIRALNPCTEHSPLKYVAANWTGSLLDILNLPNVADKEKIWVAVRLLDEKSRLLFAVTCARRALLQIKKPDIRSLIAVNLTEAYAYGRATKKELADAASAAAYAATYAARAARAAATYADAAAADAAAYAAAYAADAAYADAAADAAHATYAAEAAADAAADAYDVERKLQVQDIINTITLETI